MGHLISFLREPGNARDKSRRKAKRHSKKSGRAVSSIRLIENKLADAQEMLGGYKRRVIHSPVKN